VPISSIWRGRLSAAEWRRVNQAADRLATSRIWINRWDPGTATTSTLLERDRAAMATGSAVVLWDRLPTTAEPGVWVPETRSCLVTQHFGTRG
jgi:hypothetical protein